MAAPSAAPGSRPPEPTDPSRRRYRPPIGVPAARARPWGVPVSLLLHAALLALLIAVPALLRAVVDAPPARGAGGAGPAGGGGGRVLGGASMVEERVTFERVAAPMPTPPPPPTSVVAPAPVPPHVVVPRVVPLPVVAPATTVAVVPADSLAAAAGAGAGATGDSGGTGGAGPGTGGGVGTGTGTGRGSATGPGTGGGTGEIYPATPDVMILPPLPVPGHLHGREITLRFSIDSAGRITGIAFPPTGDDAYDRQLRARLMQYHFRPAHRPDGTPVASVFEMPMRL